MRFLLHVIMIIPELSLVIALTRRDIVNADRLAHVILLDWVKQEFSLTASMRYLELTCASLSALTMSRLVNTMTRDNFGIIIIACDKNLTS